jgi:ferredoxin-thioredoxin reductase catalytic chain
VSDQPAGSAQDAPGTVDPVRHLYERLKSVNEKRGYFFNRDLDMVFDLLAGLLLNKERYGYMCCPCRLASGDREQDRDVICPCDYRAPDVEEYGACYCALYVSKAWNDDTVPHWTVPERRPPERQAW